MRFGNSKGQLMTLIMLVVFILMLAELFAFALLNISSNSIAQSLTVSSSSANYGSLFKLSANNFASASLSRAISTLATYESTPAYRKANLISNTSQYLSYLVTNGVLPNDTSGYPQNAMGNLTLKLYNLSVANVIGFVAQSVAVNETQPIIFQTDPYHVRASYIENIAVNSSGNNYMYTIPVNVSVPLNGTPDLFYAQQGITSQIRFANIGNLTSVVGGATAYSGNALTYSYGTVYWLSSSASSGATCAQVPAGLSAASASGNIILATYNAIGLETCENNYAGLIAYIAPTTLPTVPYLIYPSSSNLLRYMPSGMKVLLYGPALETLNIEALRSAVTNGYYFSSPFASSYLDRADGNFNNQSLNGIFTFSNYNTQAAVFNGGSTYAYANALLVNTAAGGYNTVSFWMDWNGITNVVPFTFSNPYQLYLDTATCFGFNTDHSDAYGINPTGLSGNWVFVTAVFYNGGITGNSLIYINGNLQPETQCAGSANSGTASTAVHLGTNDGIGGYYFGGDLANVQIYNTSLTPPQVQKLYQEGISAVPLSNNALVSWWPLNGNANDYSGHSSGNAALHNGIFFSLLPYYNRDSILNVPVSTSLSAIPGVLSCTTMNGCSSTKLPNLFLGSMPLETQAVQGEAMFNGRNGYIESKGTLPALGTATILWWTNVNSVLGSGAGVGPSACQIYEPGATGSTFAVQFDPCTCTGYTTCSSNAAISPPTKTWVMVAFVINGNLINSYAYYGNTVLQNNALIATTTLTIPSTHFYISSYAGSAIYNHFSGGVLNVQLYNTPLTISQIGSQYRLGAYGLPLTANLIGWWPLSGDPRDYSGNGYNGMAVNVTFPYFSGVNTDPGISSLPAFANEWQALGLTAPQ